MKELLRILLSNPGWDDPSLLWNILADPALNSHDENKNIKS